MVSIALSWRSTLYQFGYEMERARWIVDDGIANASFNSLEHYLCMALIVTDSNDKDGINLSTVANAIMPNYPKT